MTVKSIINRFHSNSSKLSHTLQSGSKEFGTPVFIPRQQVIDFKYAKPEVNVWATAASLYYMLTGYYPRNFRGKDIFLEVLRNKPVAIRDRNANIPQKLAEIINLALVEEPEIYFKNAKGFKQALLSVL
ncbi:MAG: hypothetical protein AAF349_27775 [Cyanobacteria bacterium P01_A01_bin.68]